MECTAWISIKVCITFTKYIIVAYSYVVQHHLVIVFFLIGILSKIVTSIGDTDSVPITYGNTPNIHGCNTHVFLTLGHGALVELIPGRVAPWTSLSPGHNNLTCMFLACRRKQENLVTTDSGRTCKL